MTTPLMWSIQSLFHSVFTCGSFLVEMMSRSSALTLDSMSCDMFFIFSIIESSRSSSKTSFELLAKLATLLDRRDGTLYIMFQSRYQYGPHVLCEAGRWMSKWTGGDLNPRPPGCEPGIHTPELPAPTTQKQAPTIKTYAKPTRHTKKPETVASKNAYLKMLLPFLPSSLTPGNFSPS